MQPIQVSQKIQVTGIMKLKNTFYTLVNLFLRIPNYVFYILFFCSLIILEYFNFHLNPDTSIQLHTLKNFVSGHGITLTTLDNNGMITYEPCSLWPPGLVLFLSPIYLITKSTVISLLILKIISFIFFILFLSKYLNYLKLKDYQKKLIVLFCCISISPFVEFYAADMLATTLCMWSFYYYIKYQEDEKIIHLILSVFLVALCYFIKYSFLPFLFYPAVAFVLKEKWNTFKKIKKFILIIVFIFATGLLFYFLNRFLEGPSQMVSSRDAFKGNPHWNQLTRMDGFLFKFGIYEWVFQNLIKDHLGVSFQLNLISIIVTFYFYWLFLKFFFKRNKYPNESHLANSFNISLSAGALIIGFLAVLSLNNPGQTWTKPYWTFVEETRYYGPVIIIGLINVLILFFIKRKGSLIHIIVPLMIVLNLFAYRAVVQNGFWGNNYKTYALMKSDIVKQMDLKDSSNRRTLVFFDDAIKNSNYYFYLQAHGIILLSKDKMEVINRKSFDTYILEKDSANSFRILKQN